MRNTLALIGALVVGFGGVGWYLGWYKLDVSKGSDGNTEIKTSVDTKKVAEDSGAAFKQVGELLIDTKQPPAGTPGPQSSESSSVFWPVTTSDTKKSISLVAPNKR